MQAHHGTASAPSRHSVNTWPVLVEVVDVVMVEVEVVRVDECAERG
jgi:hypothetical protein